MAQDNVDIFKKVIFSIPSSRKLVLAAVLLGAVYSVISFYALRVFTSHAIEPFLIPLIAAFVFIVPVIISGELLHFSLPDYPRNWGYFLAVCNQFILFVYSLILSGADNAPNAWHIFWLGLITVYLSNFLVLALSIGEKFKRLSALSAVQPLFILVSFHVFVGRVLEIPIELYVLNLGIFFFAGIVLFTALAMIDYLMGSNLPGVSAFSLVSGLLQKEQEALDLGYPTRPDVQTLDIENEEGRARLAIPWVHPGPLEGFGGGNLTTDVIEEVNSDGDGFFLHVPSTHKSDPCDPRDAQKILDALKEPETVGEASRLLKKSYGEVTFYGRKIDGKKIIYLDARELGCYDDFELSVFREVIDPEETVLVDLHNQKDEGDRKEVWYNTETAHFLRESLVKFEEELEDEEMHDYSAGYSVDLEGTSKFALVEEVDGQETLLFGVEGNDATKNLLELEEELWEEYDEVLLFTTDTHRSIHEMASKEIVGKDEVRAVVEAAAGSVSDASIGFTSQKSEPMNLLQEDYSGLIYSINMLVRLGPLTLILLYLALIIWVF